MKIDGRKVVLVGTGFVGMSMAYSLMNTGGVSELVLVDVNQDKAIGEALDISDGLPYCGSHMRIYAGTYEDCSNADICVITAGAAQKPGQSRLELAGINAKITKSCTEEIMASGFNGIIVVASNPVDLMSYVAYKTSGLPASRVIGSGTILDTARLRHKLSDFLTINSSNMHAYVLGEHGDSSFVPWDNAYVGSVSLFDYCDKKGIRKEDLSEVYQEVRDAAYEIIERKKATYYGIGCALNRLVQAIINDENVILTVSCHQEGSYTDKDIYIGVPAIVNASGVKEIIKLEFSEEDQKKFDDSCDTLEQTAKENLKEIFK
ncbi:MAG: L-lactate dehydrogenase [Thomasclavelia sp.]|jgi:L-lactate dehydrogenase|nr:L-lactate dehydrogenase [Thomasclavelia sp.]